MKLLFERIVLFLIFGLMYVGIELLYRGYSHWTMMLLGGLCGVLIGELNEHVEWEEPLLTQCLKGACIITVLEFAFGYVLNILLHLRIWDYSNMPLNILGQVCLPFSIAWIFLSAVGIILDDWLRHWLFKEEKPHYKIVCTHD